jgi:hypothetical protein
MVLGQQGRQLAHAGNDGGKDRQIGSQRAAPAERNRCAGPAAARPCHRRARHNRRARSTARTCRCRYGRSAPPFRQRRAGNPHGQGAARGQRPARRRRESGTAWALSLPWRWVGARRLHAPRAPAAACLRPQGAILPRLSEAPEYQANAEANARAAPSQPRRIGAIRGAAATIRARLLVAQWTVHTPPKRGIQVRFLSRGHLERSSLSVDVRKTRSPGVGEYLTTTVAGQAVEAVLI